MANFHLTAKSIGRSTRNTVAAVAYRTGTQLTNMRTGVTSDYTDKDVGHVEVICKDDIPEWVSTIQHLIRTNRSNGIQAFVDVMERAEKRIDAQVYREVEFSLPHELTDEQNINLAREFLKDQCASRGMLVLASFHFDVDAETGIKKPHCHALLSLREVEEHGLSNHKNRAWNSKEFLHTLREQWAAYQNFHLATLGHEARVDHRSYEDQGIDLDPQPKMGRNVHEMETRYAREREAQSSSRFEEIRSEASFAPGLDHGNASVTEKGQAFFTKRLRNLYRILRNPEIVFTLATRREVTFTWGHIQKILHRYVDDAHLFARLDASLRASPELIPLGDSASAHTRFITKEILGLEHDLLQRVSRMRDAKSHNVTDTHVDEALTYGHSLLKDHGGLTPEQVAAVKGIVGSSQITSLIGYAGSGKTTCLQAAAHAWEAEGYNVVGLAPTGRARDNINALGIKAHTLASFFHNYENGRMQYRTGTVMVVDEAGMVGVRDMDHLTHAVQRLGVKLVLVGDSGQLKPIAAGDPYRLVMKILPSNTITSVVRQRATWQRGASTLFGQGCTHRALSIYHEKGHIHALGVKSLINDWWGHVQEHDIKQTVVLAHTRKDVETLNAHARVLMRADGRLTGTDHTHHIVRMDEDDWGEIQMHPSTRSFARGERIIFMKNDRGLGVTNGMLGTITHLKKDTVQVVLDGEEKKEVSFSTHLYNAFDHAYAITIHKTQGVTVDTSFVYPSPFMDKNLTYVAMTRHRESVQVYLDPDRFENITHGLQSLSRDRPKESAYDHVSEASIEDLIHDDTSYLEKLSTRLGNELHALGVVSKEVFTHVWDTFMGRGRDHSLDSTPDDQVYGTHPDPAYGHDHNPSQRQPTGDIHDETKDTPELRNAAQASTPHAAESEAHESGAHHEHTAQAHSVATDQTTVHEHLTPDAINTHIEALDRLYEKLNALPTNHSDYPATILAFKETAWHLINSASGLSALQEHDLNLCRMARHETRSFHKDYIHPERYLSHEEEAEKHAHDRHHASHNALRAFAHKVMAHEASSEDLMNHNFDRWDRARHHAKDYANEHNLHENEHEKTQNRQQTRDHGLEL